MTALVTGVGLIPLALRAGEPGKEIQQPMAVVILGGIVTSTLLNFKFGEGLVHARASSPYPDEIQVAPTGD